MSDKARRIRVGGAALAASLSLATVASAVPVFVVNSVLDEVDDNAGNGACHTAVGGPAAGKCTLRAAVMEAITVIDTGVSIWLPGGTYPLTLGSLDLTAPPSGNALLQISGEGAATTIIDGGQSDRILRVAIGRIAELYGVTLRNGKTPSLLDAFGGGISNGGTLTLSYCKISGNSALNHGGAVFNAGTLTLNRSTMSGNHADWDGGGIFNNGGTFNLIQSTISGNSSGIDGAGIRNDGVLSVTNSTITLNDANGDGGGIFNSSSGNANVYNSTIAFNQADADNADGGSAGGVSNSDGGIFNLRNSVVAGNFLEGSSTFDDCIGTLGAYGNNRYLERADHCTFTQGDAFGPAAQILSLAELGLPKSNGGSTATIALVAPSTMIDGAEPSVGCIGPNSQSLLTDQRGGNRIVGAECDIGAFELGALPAGLIFADGFELGTSWPWE